jgi:protoporphyrinogen oxidase
MLKKKIIISGAGLAGLSVAWHLQKKGIDCLIFEKEAEVGGVCRSTKLNGFIFDRGGHVFHFRNPYAFSFVKDLLGQNLKRHRRIALF